MGVCYRIWQVGVLLAGKPGGLARLLASLTCPPPTFSSLSSLNSILALPVCVSAVVLATYDRRKTIFKNQVEQSRTSSPSPKLQGAVSSRGTLKWCLAALLFNVPPQNKRAAGLGLSCQCPSWQEGGGGERCHVPLTEGFFLDIACTSTYVLWGRTESHDHTWLQRRMGTWPLTPGARGLLAQLKVQILFSKENG